MDRRERRRSESTPSDPPSTRRARAIGIALGGERRLAALDERDDRVAHDAAEQLFLVGEVEVDRALGDAGALGDVLEAGRGEAALREHREGGVEDLLGALLWESAPAWFGDVFGHGLRK